MALIEKAETTLCISASHQPIDPTAHVSAMIHPADCGNYIDSRRITSFIIRARMPQSWPSSVIICEFRALEYIRTDMAEFPVLRHFCIAHSCKGKLQDTLSCQLVEFYGMPRLAVICPTSLLISPRNSRILLSHEHISHFINGLLTPSILATYLK